MSKTRGSGRNQRNNPYQLEELFVKFHRTPAGIAWRWRTELTVIAVLTAAFWRLDTWTTLTWAGVILGGLAAVVLAVPHSRRFITRRFWCVLARHRLQRLCYEARLHTRSGRLPLILWTRPTQVGERTWVLCRAGISAEDFQDHIGELRAACYARDARVTRNRRWSHLVTIDIIRRDTLAASELITSPLAAPDRALPAPPRPGPGPAPGLRRRASPPPNPARRSPGTRPGAARPTPTASKGGTCHDRHRHPAAAAGAHLPVLHVRPGAPGPRRIRRARPRQPGRAQHAARRRARRGQVLRAEPDHRARRAVP